MNKKFQRALSSVLAFIMLLSCMTVMNVSSVFAATKTWDFTTDKEYEGVIQGNAGWLDGLNPLYIDATNGKFSTSERTGDAQVNPNTVIYVPVSSTLDKVTWVINSQDPSFADGGIDTLTGHGLTVAEANPEQLYKKLTSGAQGYLYSISAEEVAGVTVSGTYTAPEGSVINEIKFTDRNDNTAIYEAELDGNTFSVYVPANTTYMVTCNDIYLSANDITTESVSMEDISLTFGSIETVAVSGTITSDVSADGFLSTLIFTSMTDSSVVYEFDFATPLGTDDSYTVELPEGNYYTSAVTNNEMSTSNRVTVGSAGVDDEEIYFVSGGFRDTTYNAQNLMDLVGNDIDSWVTVGSGFEKHDTTHGIKGRYGNTITISVPSAAKVTATASYRGSFTLSGSTGTDQSASVAIVGGTASATYTTAGEDTITLTITDSSDVTYIASIAISPVVNYVSSINVPSTEYPTLTAAINAVNSMDRPAGEEGRVTINLNNDIQEQVHVTAPYITINGNNHEINWYYGMVCSYYSCDSNGYYSEELFRDKYEKRPSNASFWGGVVIVDASDFYAYDVTFKNTYNYELTQKEIDDGAEFNSNVPGDQSDRIGQLRENYISDVNPVTAYDEKERANALALTGASDRAEFYNVSILSSQDTLGYNGKHEAKAYFKNCTIGGNVDYICGAGDMIFDNCTLELYGYSDSKSNAYITAAKPEQKYLFRDCEIKFKDNGSGGINGYYGRAWASNSVTNPEDPALVDVKFINTQTNGLIVENGWRDWSYPAADSTLLNEYMNRTTGGAEFKSTYADKILTDEEYLEINDEAYLGTWLPKNYIKGVVEVEGVVIDIDGDAIVYGYIPESEVANNNIAGFTLSTATKLFDQTSLTSNTVYGAITYTNANNELDEIIAPEGQYIVAAVVEKAGGTTDPLYVRGINGLSETDVQYNSFEEFPLTATDTGAETETSDVETETDIVATDTEEVE